MVSGVSIWTFQSKLLPNGRTIDMVSDHGTTIAAFFNSNTAELDIWRSTNGGVTWTAVATNLVFSPSTSGLVYAGSNRWFFLGASTGVSCVSTNDGLTWSTFSDSSTGSGGNGVATDGAGTIVGVIVNANKVEATVNGNSPFSQFTTPTTNWVGSIPGGIIYDGTQFVVISQQPSPAGQAVYTAPTGFSIVSGPTFTQQGVSLSGAYFVQQPFGANPLFTFVPGIGYVACVTSSTYPRYVVASTPGLLTTNTPTNFTSEGTVGAGGGINYVKSAAGVLFVSTRTANIWRSFDGSTWQQDSLSQAFGSGESAGAYAFDSVNGNLIAMGDFSSVFTAPLPIVISPTSASLGHGQTQQFTATTSPAGQAVTWSCLHGSITTSGNYTAPSTGLSDVVTVALQANSNIKVTATITLNDSITISPHSISIPFGGNFHFSLNTVPAGLAATWSVNGVVGGDSVHGAVADGIYVAPAAPNGVSSVTVTAARQDFPTLTDSATVTLTIPTIGGGSGLPGGPSFITGKFRGPKVFKPVELSKAATIPLRVYEPNENKTFKG